MLITDDKAAEWRERYQNSASKHIYSATIVLALLDERQRYRERRAADGK